MRRVASLALLALLATACKVAPASPDDIDASGGRDASTAHAFGDTVRIGVHQGAAWDAGRFAVVVVTRR